MNTTTLNVLRRCGVDLGLRNAVGVQASFHRVSPGLFQPWAVLLNPVGIVSNCICLSHATGVLVSLSKASQRKLIALLFQLAGNPSQPGDYSEPDDTGREVQFILIRDILIAYWANHPVKELRIVEIEEV